MIKELERKIKELEEKRENLRTAKTSLQDDEHKAFLEGCYAGQRIELLEEIQYLRKLIIMIRGE